MKWKQSTNFIQVTLNTCFSAQRYSYDSVRISLCLCPSDIFSYISSRERNSKLAQVYFVTDNEPQPQVIVLPNGKFEDMISFGLESNSLIDEVANTVGILQSIVKPDCIQNEGGDGEGKEERSKLPSLSITDCGGLSVVMNLIKSNDLVGVFCKKGTI